MKNNSADIWFSRFIRLRDSDDEGYCKCVTCNNKFWWKSMDCGHWVKRQHNGVRFHEKNCHAQCKDCNWLKQGNDSVYEKVIIERYGMGIRNLLKSAEHKAFKQSKMDLKILAQIYKEKTILLAKSKGLTRR
ncbi:MAG TPA: recombination protein NinG [Candidatus Lokiarchaeia archaeon]